MSSLALCHPEILQLFKANFFPNITPKEPNISAVTNINKLFNSFWSIRVQCNAFSAQSQMLMGKNRNNHVRKDCSYGEILTESGLHPSPSSFFGMHWADVLRQHSPSSHSSSPVHWKKITTTTRLLLKEVCHCLDILKIFSILA